MAVGKNIGGKKGKGNAICNIIVPIILRLLERLLSGEEGKGSEISGKKIKI